MERFSFVVYLYLFLSADVNFESMFFVGCPFCVTALHWLSVLCQLRFVTGCSYIVNSLKRSSIYVEFFNWLLSCICFFPSALTNVSQFSFGCPFCVKVFHWLSVLCQGFPLVVRFVSRFSIGSSFFFECRFESRFPTVQSFEDSC